MLPFSTSGYAYYFITSFREREFTTLGVDYFMNFVWGEALVAVSLTYLSRRFK